MRVTLEIAWADSETAGRIVALKVPNPEEGSQRRCTEKSRMSSRPSQKTGMDRPIMAKIMVTVSKSEYCLIAESIPQGSPTRMAISIARAESFRVAGNTARTSWATDRLVI